MQYEVILKIVDSFYLKANHDILIGYHFRVVENFQEHIPKIADFWYLQLTGKINNPKSLPFNLLKVHDALKINRGEIGRWKMLFQKTLNEFEDENQITSEQSREWMAKVELFGKRIESYLFSD